MKTAYIMSEDGSITFVHNSKQYLVDKNHLAYNQIVETIQSKDFSDLERLLNIKQTLASQFKGIAFDSYGSPLFMGQPIPGVIGRRIRDFYKQDLPLDSLTAFLNNLQANPSFRSVNELYDFLDHNQFPITEDGCFIGYKGIRNDWKDKHSGTIDNSIGKVISMERNKVDDDRENECSYGYHVGTYEYAVNWGPRVVLVKVNPADCVSVPKDYECAKLRVCKYEVIAEAEGRIDKPHYGYEDSDGDYDDDFEESEEEYYEDDDQTPF